LKSLGIVDPFPNEERLNKSKAALPEKGDSDTSHIPLVYPAERYVEGNSPYCLYIPSNELMFKLMRACIGVKKPQDLWFINLSLDAHYIDSKWLDNENNDENSENTKSDKEKEVDDEGNEKEEDDGANKKEEDGEKKKEEEKKNEEDKGIEKIITKEE